MWKKIRKKFFSNNTEKIDYLVVGLGNPGKKYDKTAHNSGFRVVSLLQKKTDLPPLSRDNTLNSLISKGEANGKKITLLLPLTYMNLSGEVVRRAVRRFNLPPEKLVLIHDDADLQEGMVRFSFSSGSAGHKGVSSVIKNIKTKNFVRVRIGVRREEGKALSFVLKEISGKINSAEKLAAEEIESSLLLGFENKTVRVE